MATIFALASLICASANDFVFKLYGRKRSSVGLYVALIGLVWLCVFSLGAYPVTIFTADRASLGWGLLSGLCSASANILLIWAMARHDAGVCSTIYRLNLAPAVVLAVLFLNESLPMLKVLGVVAAIGGVLLFCNRSGQGSGQRQGASGLWIVAVASLLRAGMGISIKCGVSAHGNECIILVCNGLLWIVGGLVYWAIRERTDWQWSRRMVSYGMLSGALASGIVLFLTFALKYGQASVVLPISQLSFVGTTMLGAMFLREVLTTRKILGLTLAITCIILMAIPSAPTSQRQLDPDRRAAATGSQDAGVVVGAIGTQDGPFQGNALEDREPARYSFSDGPGKGRDEPFGGHGRAGQGNRDR